MRSKRGVRQGCVLSPLLFGVYTEDLAVRMRKIGGGLRVGNEVLSILLYADNIIVKNEDHEELQNILDVVSMYGRNFYVKFNDENSKVLVVNGENKDESRC